MLTHHSTPRRFALALAKPGKLASRVVALVVVPVLVSVVVPKPARV